MLNRRFRRLVSLAASLSTIAVFIINLRRGQNEQKTWGALLTRGLDIHDKQLVQKAQVDAQVPLAFQVEGVREEDDGPEQISDYYDATFDEENFGDDDVEALIKRDSKEVNTLAIEDYDIADGDYAPLPEARDYREIFSLTSNDRNFFSIYLGGDVAYNPSIVPHPARHDLWIVVAQREQTGIHGDSEEVYVCNAGFFNGVMVCTAPPTILPVARSVQGSCQGDLALFNFRSGPRDARIFFGPEAPYIVYGSQSLYTCMGIWLQDFRMLLQDFRDEQTTLVKLFKKASEIQHPEPVKEIEKNFFIFWDGQNKAYVHHDIYPNRVFAQLSFDGSIGPDLGPSIATRDGICMATYMPIVTSDHESIHQATNSLSITLCERSDPFCIADDSNTFIMTIFQHKSYYDWHSVYEPYIMLFQRTAPFAIHAISQRPLWIHGRQSLSRNTHAIRYDQDPGRTIPDGHSEMFYITSMSWKTHGQRYHGYMDDPLLLAFGIEDSRPAAMDILAGDLLQDLGYCGQ